MYINRAQIDVFLGYRWIISILLEFLHAHTKCIYLCCFDSNRFSTFTVFPFLLLCIVFCIHSGIKCTFCTQKMCRIGLVRGKTRIIDYYIDKKRRALYIYTIHNVYNVALDRMTGETVNNIHTATMWTSIYILPGDFHHWFGTAL